MLTIYKTFVRSNLDYGNIIYDQTYNASFHRKLESIHYSTCLAITGTIRGTSYEKLNQELSLGAVICLYYKIFNNKSPSYLSDYIPSTGRIYSTRHAANVPTMKSKHTFFKNSYIPSKIIKWDKLDQDIRNAGSYLFFRKHLLTFVRPAANSIFNVHNAKRIKLLIRQRVGFSHLKQRKSHQRHFTCKVKSRINFGDIPV